MRTPLLLVGTAALLSLAFTVVPPAPAGPGAIVDLLRTMFTAIDTGDRATAKACIATEARFPVLVWDLDLENKPVAVSGSADALKYMDSLFDGMAQAKATIVSKVQIIHADCHSPELGYATLEFAQTVTVEGKPTTSNYRATALVTNDKQNKWRVFHWHASLVPAAAPAAPAAPGAKPAGK